MKAILALALLLVFAGLMFQYHTDVHPLYSSQTEQYRDYLKHTIVPQINSMNTTWKAGYNKRFDGMDYEAIKTLNGALIDEQPNILPVMEEVADDIPDSFDAREQWPTCDSIKEIRDQANCGSCWSFGAAEAMSDRYCIKYGKQDRISTEDLLSCCSYCGNGCQGGYPTMAWAYFKNTGLCTGDLYGDKTWCRAYSIAPCNHHVDPPGSTLPACEGDEPTPSCVKSCDSGSQVKNYKADKHKGKSAYSIAANVKALQTDIQSYGSIECAFNVYEDFYTYTSGVYQHKTGRYQGGHAIKMLGWGVENGTPYWLCANSWNENWGDKGFFKILRGSDECGIEKSCVAGQL